MRKWLVIAVACGLVVGLARLTDVMAEEAQQKAPGQRILVGDDAKKAAELAKKIDEHKTADRYAEATNVANELLALRQKVQGAEHWEAINQRWVVDGLKKVTALRADQRAEWHNAVQTAGEAQRLYTQGKYTEAQPLFQKALEICRKVLGEEHPDMAQISHALAANLIGQAKYGEAQTLVQQALKIQRKVLGEEHPDTAQSYNTLAANLNAQGKLREAQLLFQQALQICRKVLGEEHPDTAQSYNNVAYNLNAQGKYAEAQPLYQKALEIYRRVLGEEHPETAMSYNNVAANLDDQSNYAEATPLYQKALEIQRKVLGEEHPDMATSYNNLAANLHDQGKYAEAQPLYQRALEIQRRALGEEHPYTANSYNNVAANLKEQGKYAEAQLWYQKALELRLKAFGEEHPLTATSYNSLAVNLDEQGKYAEAQPLYQKALEIRLKVFGDEHRDTAISYHELASNLDRQRKYAEAQPLQEQALKIQLKVLGKEHRHTATSYHNLATNLNSQGKYAEAHPLYRTALSIQLKVLGEGHPNTTMSYGNLAINLNAQGKYGDALAHLEAAVRSYEATRLVGAERALERGLLRGSPYALLAALRVRGQTLDEAWKALESGFARGLLDEAILRRGSGLSDTERKQRQELLARRSEVEVGVLRLVTNARRSATEESELKTLLEVRARVEQQLSDLAVTLSRRQVATLGEVQTVLPANAALVAWVDVADKSGGVQEHWACIVRDNGVPTFERLPGSGTERGWTKDDSQLATLLREALARPATAAAEIEALSQRLYAQRLAPLEKHLEGVKRLYVVPVEQRAGIPLEVLTDRYTISYTPSGTQLARRHKQPRPSGPRMLLAIGDPFFTKTDRPKPTSDLPPGGLLITQVAPGGNAAKARLQARDVLVRYAGTELKTVEQLGQLIAAQAGAKTVGVTVWREGQGTAVRDLAPGRLGVVLAKEPALQAIAERRKTDLLLASLRGGDWAELPGTRVEIARLGKLFDSSATILADSAASEQTLEALRASDKLKGFRYLHLATHGQTNNAKAFESALILANDKLPKELPRAGQKHYDGRLTANEVLENWKLEAELVTLSACESGLGRPGGGDGLLGFAQAFLLAGSRSVCLSLWKVDDAATALLMDRFYQNLLGQREGLSRPMPKAAALAEAKQWLRQLPAGEAVERTAELMAGVARGKGQKLGPLLASVPKLKEGIAEKDYKPYAHPRYWAAFVLFGDPD
jgi:CHAT domain-containing protein/Tfp pilus assembly protein PilF